MISRAAAFLLAIALAGGCTTLPDQPSSRAEIRQPPARGADRPSRSAQISDVLARAALQVRGCYRSPRVSSRGRQIVTRLRVRFTPDGQLAGLPVVMFQDGVTPENQTYAERMAQAAIEAVMRCTPLRLPPELYQDGWSRFELTFSPHAAT